MSKQFGVNLWWTIPTFVQDGNKAQEALEKHGFEKEDMPLPTRRSVVSRAAYSFQDRRHKDGRRVTEKAKDTDSCVVYGILSQKRKGAEEVGYDQGTTIRLDKDSGRVEAEGPQTEEFFKALERYEGAITDEDVRLFLRRVVRMCKGVAKRPSGGIYFVPEMFVSIVESASYVLEDLGVGAKLYLEGLTNGVREREIVWEAVESEINKKIDDTLNAVERIEKRASSVVSHDAKLSEMTQLMDIYRELLGEEAKYEELAERLEDATQKVAAKLDELQNDTGTTPVKTAKKTVKKTVVKAQASSGSKGVGQEVVELAVEILKDAGKPMHYRNIAAEAEARGFELRGSKDGASWLNAWICETFRHGNSPFKRVGRGEYTLAS